MGMGQMFPDEAGRFHRFVLSSLVAHAVLVGFFLGFGPYVPVPVERPLKVQIMGAPAARPAAPNAPAGPALPGPQVARPDTTPELIEMPKPKVEEAPRSKRFAGLHDRRGGPAPNAPIRDAEGWTRNAPKVEGGSLRGEEAVRPPAVPPGEAAPAVALPAPSQGSQVAKVEPIPPGRTALVQPVPPVAPKAPSGTAPSQGARSSRPSLRDQVASLALTYRPPVEDQGTGGDPTGRGEPGLDTFRFKYATWGLAVKRDIERAWRVPPYGVSSLAIVRFNVLPDGRIRNLGMEKSSGLAVLDQAATNAITDAAPFRPFPPRMREDHPGGIEILVNFYYREGRGILQWE